MSATVGNSEDTIRRDVASAVAGLDDAQAESILDALRRGDWPVARDRLLSAVPEVEDDRAIEAPAWRDALQDELQFRVLPPGDDEQDDVETREVPDYARFAHRS
ncbi:MAG: hypothetical protein R3F59_24055 [Myxococcota bacterium]